MSNRYTMKQSISITHKNVSDSNSRNTRCVSDILDPKMNKSKNNKIKIRKAHKYSKHNYEDNAQRTDKEMISHESDEDNIENENDNKGKIWDRGSNNTENIDFYHGD